MAIREIASFSPNDVALMGHTSVAGLESAVQKQLTKIATVVSLCANWIEHRFVSVTAAYTVDDETVVLADATGGAFAVTLPLSNSETINRDIHVKRLNGGANAVTITAAGTDTIDGAATQVLAAQYATLHMLSDGAGKWHIL